MAMELLEYIIENLVDHPDEVHIQEIPGEEEHIVEVRVADSDVGKVIGKNGSVAKALRTILAAVGSHRDTTYILEIVD